MTPSPADFLQYGALGLLALGCVSWFGLTAWVIKRSFALFGEVRYAMHRMADALLLLKDPSVRSYLTELRDSRQNDEPRG